MGSHTGSDLDAGQHDALDALAVGIYPYEGELDSRRRYRGILDAVSREWMMRFVEHRIGDRRINRLVRKWLKAGVMEEGKLVSAELSFARPRAQDRVFSHAIVRCSFRRSKVVQHNRFHNRAGWGFLRQFRSKIEAA